MAALSLREVDQVEIVTVVDNTIDMLMAGTPHVKRSRCESTPCPARASSPSTASAR